ncbi:hypothetical protein L195_g055372, partial [Trifolium pratense]
MVLSKPPCMLIKRFAIAFSPVSYTGRFNIIEDWDNLLVYPLMTLNYFDKLIKTIYRIKIAPFQCFVSRRRGCNLAGQQFSGLHEGFETFMAQSLEEMK